MRNAGALTVAQDEASCVVFGMPKEAIARNAVVEVVPLFRLAETTLKLVEPLPAALHVMVRDDSSSWNRQHECSVRVFDKSQRCASLCRVPQGPTLVREGSRGQNFEPKPFWAETGCTLAKRDAPSPHSDGCGS